jgi:hypothetical protein
MLSQNRQAAQRAVDVPRLIGILVLATAGRDRDRRRRRRALTGKQC